MECTVKIRLESPIITQFQSDTLFGHICWAIRYVWGEKHLTEFLCKYKGESPPLLVSNGSPEGFLPKPILPPPTQEDLQHEDLREMLGGDRVANAFKIKSIKKARLVPISILQSLSNSDVSPQRLFVKMYERYDAVLAVEKSRVNMSVRHNTVNRIKNKVEEGLFDQAESFSWKGFDRFCVYLRTDFSEDEVRAIFEFIGENGFGKDKNTGKGHFTVIEVKPKIDLPRWDNPNAFMTLSSYIPTEDEKTMQAYYRVIQKHGKLGGTFAQGNPFKRPLLMLDAGSVFFDNPLKESYGSLIPNVHHTHEQVRHYAYAFPVGLGIEIAGD